MRRILTLPALVLGLAACHERDLGSGINTMDREYAKPAAETWKASVKSVEAAGLTVVSRPNDELGGDLIARRPNGDEVRVKVRSLDARRSQVSVRVEPGDRDLANLIHERIADNVGLGTAKAGLFGGDVLEAEYLAAPEACLKVAKRVFDVLKVETTGEENHVSWSRIDGRLKGGTPVGIRMEKTENMKTQVQFVAGNDKSDDNKAFVHRMKAEFDASFRPD